MISFNGPESEWFSEDAQRLRTFLETPTGQRMLAKLVSARPSFAPANAHPHKSFAQARDIAGYEKAIEALMELMQPPQEPEKDLIQQNYPALDDDTAWKK